MLCPFIPFSDFFQPTHFHRQTNKAPNSEGKRHVFFTSPTWRRMCPSLQRRQSAGLVVALVVALVVKRHASKRQNEHRPQEPTHGDSSRRTGRKKEEKGGRTQISRKKNRCELFCWPNTGWRWSVKTSRTGLFCGWEMETLLKQEQGLCVVGLLPKILDAKHVFKLGPDGGTCWHHHRRLCGKAFREKKKGYLFRAVKKQQKTCFSEARRVSTSVKFGSFWCSWLEIWWCFTSFHPNISWGYLANLDTLFSINTTELLGVSTGDILPAMFGLFEGTWVCLNS